MFSCRKIKKCAVNGRVILSFVFDGPCFSDTVNLLAWEQDVSAQVDASGFPPLKADFRPITWF